MSSSDSEDSYEYCKYVLNMYERQEGPPLIKKKSRLIAAVVQNHVEILRDLLDSPRWYNVRDKYGYSLLQIAILRDNIEVFDYMLSIPDFPIEFVNKEGQTALVVALDEFVHKYGNYTGMSEHFAYELIRKGACIDQVCYGGFTPLHCALNRYYYETAKLLIQKGVDVNLHNNSAKCSPLDMLLSRFDDVAEIVATLLAYGAEPTIHHFESSVLYSAPFEIQEVLFFYIHDQYSRLELRLDVLLKLAEEESALFYSIIGCPIRITIQDGSAYSYFRKLCSMNIDCLHLVILNCGKYIQKAFSETGLSSFYVHDYGRAINLENLNAVLESELKPSVITFISTLDSSGILQDLIGFGCDETTVTRTFCYLLSYGLNIKELDLQIVYNKFSYCKLFKILLHMDVQMNIRASYTKNIMPVFIYDVSMNLDKFFQNYSNYCANSINELRNYFVHPTLNEICYNVNDTTDDSSEESSQEMPILVELARNAFRKFFIETFEIRSCKEFYTLLKNLEISDVYKKIITYETKLY